jgi:hypothetical protein
MPFARKSQEEKDARSAEKQAGREAKGREKRRRSFYASAVGEARIA